MTARREVGKWLNERPNRDLPLQAVAELCAEHDAAMACLHRIVSYYDDPRCGKEYRGLPGLDIQAKAQHENTMFGEARALLAERIP